MKMQLADVFDLILQFHYSSNPSAALTWAESQGIVIPLHGCREQSRQQEQVLYSNSKGCFWGGNKKSLSFCCLILHTAPLAALLILQLSFLWRVPAATAKSGLRWSWRLCRRKSDKHEKLCRHCCCSPLSYSAQATDYRSEPVYCCQVPHSTETKLMQGPGF